MTDYSIKDVTADLGFLLSLTGSFSADSENFWHDDLDNVRYVYKLDSGDKGHEIALFQDPLPKGDYYYFNPFSEGLGKKSPATQHFNKAVRIFFNLNFRTALLWMVDEVLKHKQAASDTPLHHAVLRMTSGSVGKNQTLYDVIDETVKAEFRKIFDRLDNNAVAVPYLIQQMTAKVTCAALSDPEWDEQYGKEIRKKSLVAFKAALMGVLGIAAPAELSQFTVKYDPELKTAASFYTAMSVYLRLYSRFNDVLAEAYSVEGVAQPIREINLGEFTQVIERFTMAYAIAKHMSQPILPSVSATSTNTADTSKLSIAKPTGSRFAAPETLDSYGRTIKSPGALSLSISPSKSRFSAEVIPDKTDPFAPPVMAPLSGGMGGGGGSYFGSTGTQSFGQSSFGGGLNMGMGSGLDLTPPSNFNSPVSRWA